VTHRTITSTYKRKPFLLRRCGRPEGGRGTPHPLTNSRAKDGKYITRNHLADHTSSPPRVPLCDPLRCSGASSRIANRCPEGYCGFESVVNAFDVHREQLRLEISLIGDGGQMNHGLDAVARLAQRRDTRRPQRIADSARSQCPQALMGVDRPAALLYVSIIG